MKWADVEAEEPELAAFASVRLLRGPAYLATVRANGVPRVHPVTPIIGGGRLFVFMEPSSPKGRDLRERTWYALHNGVPDTSGTGGEVWLDGRAAVCDDGESRAVAADAARYTPSDRYVLFELDVRELRCNGYGDVTLPERRRWRDRSDGDVIDEAG